MGMPDEGPQAFARYGMESFCFQNQNSSYSLSNQDDVLAEMCCSRKLGVCRKKKWRRGHAMESKQLFGQGPG